MLHRYAKKYSRVITAAMVITALLCSTILLDFLFPLKLPSPDDLFTRVVVDKDGRPLRAFPDSKGVWRYAITLEDISPLYLEALLNYEDRRFWQHPGIDPLALARATISNIRHKTIISGGSTLSMQVARLLHPHSRSISGKLYQILRTLQLEWHLSKKQILTLYCNIAPFGGTVEGVQAASFTYLNKPASELTRAEAALLAVLPQSPTRFRPDLHPQAAQNARDKVLDRLNAFGKWSTDEVDSAKLEPVIAYRHAPPQYAPLLSRRLITQQQGITHTIQTTVDGELQRALEDYLHYYVEGQAEKTSAAALVLDNTDNSVLAYIGTADFGNPTRFGHVDMVQAIRSPGSTLKPFLYAMAMDKGFIHSHSLLNDTPQNWHDYRPGNFSGGFSGPVSVAEALQRSLNIPAVSLMEKFGPANFSARLQNAGLQLISTDKNGNLAVILGGVGITLEDLVIGYSAFANKGRTRPLKYLKKSLPEQERFFFSEQAAWTTQHILSGVDRPDAIHRISALASRDKLAWKTGTSYGFRDSWAIGLDRNYTIGVWVGRPDGTPSPGASGRSHAGPLLHAIADHLENSRQPIAKPQKIKQQEICWPLGTLKNEQELKHCHATHLAWIINDTVPPTWPDKLQPFRKNPLLYSTDTKTGDRVHSGCSNENIQQQSVALWPLSLEPWIKPAYRQRRQLPPLSPECPQAVDSGVDIKIGRLETGSIFQAPVNLNRALAIPLQASGGEGIHSWYINGHFHHQSHASAAGTAIIDKAGEYQIVVSDSRGNVDKVRVEVR
ncbi:penicillin-binding protein 1C [Teredinibacter haidensis]|uniref:penicillin-binding protein 1C n=1 Tax=Teredinibacter haidensis TaxID=2731755 RepID=UPI000948E2B7|nr:penicillin-binding protein 1C [Teredinibacter haidensis]